MHTLLLLALLQATPPPRPALPCLEHHPCATAPAAAPVIYTREPRSRVAFWTGLGMVGAGATLAVLSGTTLQSSDRTASPLGLPCGTDPVLAQGRVIAPCRTNTAVLATGVALAGGGAVLMVYGGRTVEVIVSPSTVAMRLRF
jgi:hypothetical protein